MISMKKNINTIITILLAVLTVAFASCSNEYEPVFDETPDDRLREQVEEMRTLLLSAPNGWKGHIFTGTGPGFFFYFDFQENGKVRMVSDFDEESGSEVMDATYLLKGLQRPTLSFDTYSYIHLLSDPTGSVNGGIDGVGLISDFEFSLDSNEEGVVELTGIKNGVKMTMTQATAQEEDEYLDGIIGNQVSQLKSYITDFKFPYVEVSTNTKLAVKVDTTAKIFSLLFLDQDKNVVQLASRYTHSNDGLLLAQPLQYGSNLTFQEVLWDPIQDNYYLLNGSSRLYFENDSAPVIPLVYALGFLHQYVFVDPSVQGYQAKLPADFLNIYNTAKTGVFNVDDYQLELIAFSLLFDASNTVYMDYYVQNSTGTYRARFTYSMSVNSAGKATFNFVAQDANAAVIASGLAPLLNYFKNNTFNINYYEDTDFGVMAGFYPEQSPTAYFYGFLE